MPCIPACATRDNANTLATGKRAGGKPVFRLFSSIFDIFLVVEKSPSVR